MRRKTLISLVLVLVLASLSFATAAADDPAMVYVGHGIPWDALPLGLDEKLPVDVLVNETDCLLKGFEFGEFAGPVELAAGPNYIKISLAAIAPDEPCSGEPVIEAEVEFAAGFNYTVFAHLTADGLPGADDVLGLGITASVFENDVSAAVAGYTRLTVRHTAAAPAVDIELFRGWEGGRFVGQIEGLENPNESDPLNIRPGGYEAVITADGDEVEVPDDLLLVELKPHKSYIVYAVGGLDPDTFTVLRQVLDLTMVPPARPVPPGGPPPWAPPFPVLPRP